MQYYALNHLQTTHYTDFKHFTQFVHPIKICKKISGFAETSLLFCRSSKYNIGVKLNNWEKIKGDFVSRPFFVACYRNT